MARLPDSTAFGARPTPQASTAIQTYDGTRVAQSAARFGATIASIATEELQRRDKLKYAEVKSSVLQEEMRVRQELEADPDWQTYGERYEAAMGKVREKAKEALGANFFRGQLEIEAGDIAARGGIQVQGMARQKKADQGKASLNALMEGNRAGALEAGDEATKAAFITATHDAIEAARAQGIISDVQAGDLGRGWTESYAQGSLDMMPAAQRLRALRSVGEGSIYSFIQPDKRAVMERNASREVQAEIAAAQKEARARFQSDLEIAVSRGEAGELDVESAFDRGAISASTRTSLIKYLDKNATSVASVEAALLGMNILDPSSADDKKAVNSYFERHVAPQLADLEVGEAQAVITGFVDQTGIVPEPVRGLVRGALRAGTPEQKASAAAMLDRIGETNPALLRDFSGADIATGTQIAMMVRDGVEPARAVEMADRMQRVDPGVKKIREQELTKVKDNATSRINREAGLTKFFGLFTSGREPPAAARAEYRRAFDQAYVLTGDADTAAEVAGKTVKENWGVSRVNNPSGEVMKYAPEVLYGVMDKGKRDAAWIREQLESEIVAQGAFDLSLGNPADRVILTPDPRTARDFSYTVMMRDENGFLNPMIGADGRPMRWRPEYKSSPAAIDAQAAIEDARADTLRRAQVQRELSEAGFIPEFGGSGFRLPGGN
jgi:hypothetical protein